MVNNPLLRLYFSWGYLTLGVGWHGYLHPMQVISTNSMSHETRIPKVFGGTIYEALHVQSQSSIPIIKQYKFNTKHQRYSLEYYKHIYKKHHATITCTIELLHFRGFCKKTPQTSSLRKPSGNHLPNLLQEPKVTQVADKHITMPGLLSTRWASEPVISGVT